MTPRHIAVFTVVAALAAGSGYLVGQWLARGAQPELQAFTRLPQPRDLPAVTLDLGSGPAPLAAPDGRATLLFFGFTHCPDVCPTTLALLARSVAMLPVAQRPRVLFVSVDPDRDAQPKAGEFARWFAPEFVGATTAELPALAAALGAPYGRNPTADGYTMDHSGALFLLDAQGRFVAVATGPHDATVLATDLAALAEPR